MKKPFLFLFSFLCVFILLDFITTYFGLTYLNAIELNPLYQICGNINLFFITKFLFTLIGLSGLFYLSKDYPNNTLLSISFLFMLYGIIVTSNIYQIIQYI